MQARFEGTGCYTDEKTSMIYSVVSTEEAKYLVKKVHEIDPKAFVNTVSYTHLYQQKLYRSPCPFPCGLYPS